MVYICLILILTNIRRTKVYHSEPKMFGGKVFDQRIKDTIGITG